MADAHFDALVLKYRPVIELIERSGGRIHKLALDNGRLLLRARVPSLEAEGRAFDEIKLVDPSYSDLTPQISSDEALPTETATDNGAEGTEELYTVQAGDTLRRIAASYYGDPALFTRIYEANRDRMHDPDDLRPGQRLVIPMD